MAAHDLPDRSVLAAELAELGVTVAPEQISTELLTHNPRNQITEGVWIVRAGDFEAVLKVVVNQRGGDIHWQPLTVPTAWNYWRREADVYEMGLSRTFAGSGVRGPRVLGILERSPASRAVWLELVPGRSGHGIDEAAIVDLSHRLGQGQGSWSAGGGELPAFASRRFLREYTASKTLGWDLLDNDEAWRHPVVATGFPDGLREGGVRLHAEREWFLAVMEQLPRTLAHLVCGPTT